MPQLPTTQDEWTIHALNIHGVFFERRCAHLVTQVADWTVVSTNYPVEFPPPNGPWRGKESSLDIWARRDNDLSAVVDVFIECKKANPEFVNWVFFPKHGAPTPVPFCFTKTINTPSASSSGPWVTQVVIQYGTTTAPIASDAREVRGDYLSHHHNNKTKTSNAAIQDAAYQVALACRALVQEETSLLGKARQSPEHAAPPWLSKSYIPVVVTTANLYQVDFSPNCTDLTSGEIDFAKATLNPVKSILYEYALPKHLQFSPQDPLAALKGTGNDTFSRMHVLVVHADSLADLLREMFASSS